jgi:predicted MFS family arabinose efflux permease
MNYPMLLLAVALAGARQFGVPPGGLFAAEQEGVAARLGYAFSVHGLSGNLGWAIGATISGMALAWAGWRGAGLAAALVALARSRRCNWRGRCWMTTSQKSAPAIRRWGRPSASSACR